MPKNVDIENEAGTIPVDLGVLADQLYKFDAKLGAANAKVKEIENEKKEVENTLLAAMQAAGTDICRGKTATVSISTLVRPRIEDFEKFATFVRRKNALHLFERRIASTAYKELKDELGGKPIPGVSEFVQERLNCRKA
jgi:hypothetical protein